MKDSNSNRQLTGNSLEEEKMVESIQRKVNFSPKTVASTIPDQLIVPPASVWDKIEKILDEQDNRRDEANEIISNSLGQKKLLKEKKFYLATLAGLTVAAGIIWISINF